MCMDTGTHFRVKDGATASRMRMTLSLKKKNEDNSQVRFRSLIIIQQNSGSHNTRLSEPCRIFKFVTQNKIVCMMSMYIYKYTEYMNCD